MDAPPLIAPQVLEQLQAQIRALGSRRNKRSLSAPNGSQHSVYRGAGMELQDLRGYEFGDDVRHIAWRSSARTNRPMVKVFHAEKQARHLIYVEQHDSMYFATAGELKAATAVRIAALLSFNGLFKQAEIGGITWGQSEQLFPFSHRLDQVLALLRSINSSTPPQHRSQPQVFIEQLHRLATQQCDIYLISDFNHWQEHDFQALQPLAERHRLWAIQIADQGEQSLADWGKLKINLPGGEQRLIDTSLPSLRQRYNEAMRTKQTVLEQMLKQAQAIHHICYTHQDALQTVEPLL